MAKSPPTPRAANQAALSAATQRSGTLDGYAERLDGAIGRTADPTERASLEALKGDVDKARDVVGRERTLRDELEGAYAASTEKNPNKDPVVVAKRAEIAALQQEKVDGSCVKNGNVNDAVLKCLKKRIDKHFPEWARYGKKGGPRYPETGEHTLENYSGWDGMVKDGKVTDAQRKVASVMSANEGGFDSVQAYDNQTLTAGVMQKTINPDGGGELAQQLSDFKTNNPDDYKRLFGDRGWSVAGDPPTVSFQTSDGSVLTGSALEKYIKSDDASRWEATLGPFRDAGRDPAWQQQQVGDFATRMDNAVGANPKGYDRPISDFLSSERAAAQVLDQSVNRPGHVSGDVGRALDAFYTANPTASRDPSQWTDAQRAQYEPDILSRYIDYRGDHSKAPMTDNQGRAGRINNSTLSDTPGTYRRPGG